MKNESNTNKVQWTFANKSKIQIPPPFPSLLKFSMPAFAESEDPKTGLSGCLKRV